MAVALDISASDIRLTRVENDRITVMEGYPIPADVDPITALANAPLPRPLGPVRVSFAHPDMLLRVMLQPPAPPERLARIIRFELQNLGGGEQMLVNWSIPPVGGTGDMRILTQVAKRSLVDQLQAALAEHQGRLASLVDPAVALFLGFRRSCPTDQGNQVVIDCSTEAVQMAFVQDGDLIFFRNHKPGFSDLVAAVADLRGVDNENAERLLRKLSSGAPDDIKELIRRQCHSIAAAISNNVRFAKTQLKVAELDLHAVYVCGKAARLPGLTDFLAERLHVPVRIHNPFVGLLSDLQPDLMDQYAQLPSAWGASLGLAATEEVPLDVLEEVRAEKRAFWQKSGLLRVAALTAAAIMVLAIILQSVRIGVQSGQIAELRGPDDQGMVPRAEQAHAELKEHRQQVGMIADRIRYLDNERRTVRVASELLTVAAGIQHPEDRPVYIDSYALRRNPGGGITVELKGYAEEGSDRRGRNQVLAEFKTLLQQHYPVIATIDNRQMPIEATRLPFHWIITIPDRV